MTWFKGYGVCILLTLALSSSPMEISHLYTYNFKRTPSPLNLFYTYSHSFLRACGVLWIL